MGRARGRSAFGLGVFWFFHFKHSPLLPKGNQVNIPEPKHGYFYGNVNESRDTNGSPKKGYLFFLTAGQPRALIYKRDDLGNGSAGDQVGRLVKHLKFRGVWCAANGP